MKNEALRLFLAITALILTAMLTNPIGEGNEASSGFALKGRSTASQLAVQKHGKRVAVFKNSKKYRPAL